MGNGDTGTLVTGVERILTGGLVVGKSIVPVRMFGGVAPVLEQSVGVHICIHLTRAVGLHSPVVRVPAIGIGVIRFSHYIGV